MNFNLTTDPWIPVRWLDGRFTSVSLQELFGNTPQIADLAVPPHERISILRLLVCITQAAHGAPETSDDWQGWDEGLESSVTDYLTKWQEHFNLIGDGPRFLQAPITDDKDYPTAQIVFHFATGFSTTLLDHEGDNDRDLSPAFIARALLSYQNHFVGGSMGRAFKLKGIAGTAINALHSFLIGADLRETIILNCIDEQTLSPSILGRPVWEGVASDYLARLAPTPCKLWLTKESHRIRISQGAIYGNYSSSKVRESSATVVEVIVKNVPTKVLLRASPRKGIWRDLHLITMMNQGALKGTQSSPLTFQSHFDQMQDSSAITFWSGELVKAKDAKILDAVESVFTVPFYLFTPVGQNRYQDGIEFAEKIERRLMAAVYAYGMYLSTESKIKGGESDGFVEIVFKKLRNPKRKKSHIEDSTRHFWNTLDQQSTILLTLLEGIGTDHDPMGSSDFGKGRDPWTLAVRAAADAAYEHTCPRGNPRQLQAYAAGLRVLRPLPKKSTTKKTPAPINS